MPETQRIYLYEPSEQTLLEASGILPTEIWHGDDQYGAVNHAAASQNTLIDPDGPLGEDWSPLHLQESAYGLGTVVKFQLEQAQVMQALTHAVCDPTIDDAFAILWVGAVTELGSSGFFNPARKYYDDGWGFEVYPTEIRFLISDGATLDRARVQTIDPIDKKIAMLGVMKPVAGVVACFTNLGQATDPIGALDITPTENIPLTIGNYPEYPGIPSSPDTTVGADAEFKLAAYWQHEDVEDFTQQTLDNILAVINF